MSVDLNADGSIDVADVVCLVEEALRFEAGTLLVGAGESINEALATGAAVIRLEGGDYLEVVVITRPVRIVGPLCGRRARIWRTFFNLDGEVDIDGVDIGYEAPSGQEALP